METITQNKTPLLSIVMPVYNVELYLEEAVNSLLKQSFHDYEILAINDGSEDRSGKILDSYASKDDRIKVYHRENRGLSAARNTGLNYATGSYIYFFDSDDLLSEGALSGLISLISEKNCDMIAFSGICIDEKSKPVDCSQPYIKPDLKKPVPGSELFVRMMQNHQYSPVVSMYLYRKSFLIASNLEFSEGYIHEDEPFTIQALFLAKKVVSTGKTYHLHRKRTGSIMSENYGQKNLAGWAHAVSLILGFMERKDLNGQERKMVLKRANTLAKNCASILLRLNKETDKKYYILDYFTEGELNMLSFEVSFKLNTPNIYRIYNRLRTLISIR